MIRYIRLVGFVMILCVSPALSHAASDAVTPQPLSQAHPIEFSAQVVRSNSMRGYPPDRGMLYVGQQGIRTELTTKKQKIWMIFKPKAQVVWTIFPEQRVYLERSGLAVEWPPLPEDKHSPCREALFHCQKKGWRTLQNRSVLLWQIDVVEKAGKRAYAQLWVDPRLNVAIREEYADGLTVEMRHIHEAQQDANLFELPVGYRKTTLPVPPKTPNQRTTPSP